MRKLILISILAMTSVGCPDKNKNGGSQVAVNPNLINGYCQNSYYNPQTGQQTSYNPGTGVGVNTVGSNCNYYGSNMSSYGIQCYPGYYAVYYANGAGGCVAASWANSYATNAYVYSYYNSYWSYAGSFGAYGNFGTNNAFRGCSDNSFCNCAFVNNTGFGVCTY